MGETQISSMLDRAVIKLKQPWRVLESKPVSFNHLTKYGVNAFTFECNHPDTGKPISAKVIGVEAVPMGDTGRNNFYGHVRFDVDVGSGDTPVYVFMEPDIEKSKAYSSFKAYKEQHGEKQTKVNFSEQLLRKGVEQNMDTPKRHGYADEIQAKIEAHSSKK